MNRKLEFFLKTALAVLIAAVMLFPLVCIIFAAFMGKNEAVEYFGAVFGEKSGYARLHIFPMYPTLRYYVRLLLDSPEFYAMSGNSLVQTASIIIGQTLFAMPAAWGMTQYDFRFRQAVFMLYIILMIMPFQVTMVSSYVILDGMGLIDTLGAVIIPNIFSAIPVFIMAKSYESLPPSLIEAAYLDGANELQTFLHIGIPAGMSGAAAAAVLSFIEYLGNIEQPLTFLKSRRLWTLPMYFPQITADNINVSMAAAVVIMIPPVLVFAFGRKYAEQGITVSGLKE